MVNCNTNVTSEKKMGKSFFATFLQHSIFNDTNEPTTLLNNNDMNNCSCEQINFVSVCKEKIDRSKLPVNFDEWTVKQQCKHLMDNVDKYFENIPVSLRYILPAIFKDGDCGQSMRKRPDWLDMDKFRRGQAFAQRYFACISATQLMSLFQVFIFADGLKTMIISQKSNTPYRAFRRYLSTILRVSHWYQEDPWDERTQAHQDIKAVRKMHLAMRRRLSSYDYEQIDLRSQISCLYDSLHKTIVEDFKDTCSAASDLQCPFTITRLKNINQGDMSLTQGAFMGLVVFYPEKFGVHNTCDEDLEAFCHMWRGIGYLLGIEDRYNFCRGSLEDVRTRVKDAIVHWLKPNFPMVTPEWEHMCMCLSEGLKYYLPFTNYKIFLLYVCSVLELNMPRLYRSLSLMEKILYAGINFFTNYLMRLPGVVALTNMFLRRRLNRAINFGIEKHTELRKKSYKFNKK